MKSSMFVAVVLLSVGCDQGGQTAPPATSGSGSVAVAQKPAEPPAPTAPPRVRLSIPAGTQLPIEMGTTVSTDASREGDSIIATLTEEVVLDGFKLDRGAEVRGRVFTSVPAKRVKGRARLVIGFESVMESGEKLSIETEPIDSLAASTKSKDTKIMAGGALGGLIVGALKDGKKGAAIGTAIGAAAGVGTVLVMKGDEVEIPRGARLIVTVTK